MIARRMPSDTEFERALRTRSRHAFKCCFYLLTTLESSWQAKGPLGLSGGTFSMKYIMPKNAFNSVE